MHRGTRLPRVINKVDVVNCFDEMYHRMHGYLFSQGRSFEWRGPVGLEKPLQKPSNSKLEQKQLDGAYVHQVTSRQPLWILLIRLINENNPIHPACIPLSFPFSPPLSMNTAQQIGISMRWKPPRNVVPL